MRIVSEHLLITPPQVDGRIFAVSDRRFRRESNKSRALLARRSERKDGVVVVTDILCLDFERFLQVIHCEYVLALKLTEDSRSRTT
jgi:hypothetical protein